MSRRTHVPDSHRHDRGSLVSQRRRHDRRRFRLGKQTVPSHALEFHMNSPEAARIDPHCIAELKAHLGQDGPVLYLAPEQMRRLPAELRACFEPYVRHATELHVAGEPAPPTSRPRPREKRTWRSQASAELAGD